MTTRNNPASPLTMLCLALETEGRTPKGRVIGAQQFVDIWFPHSDQRSTDRLFCHLPKKVRGRIITRWGFCGPNAAAEKDDAGVAMLIHEHFLSGDLDAEKFEEGISPPDLIENVPLEEWWKCWRRGMCERYHIYLFLSRGYTLQLFTAAFVMSKIHDPMRPHLSAIDLLLEHLTKDQVVAIFRRVEESQDGSHHGLLMAIGWELLAEKLEIGALEHLTDALASEIGLVPPEVLTDEIVSTKAETAESDDERGGEAAATARRPSAPAEEESPSIRLLAVTDEREAHHPDRENGEEVSLAAAKKAEPIEEAAEIA